MINLIAQAISAVASPLVIAIPFSYILIAETTGNHGQALVWSAVSAFFVSLVGAFVWWGVRKGFFTNLDVSDRRQRPKLFLFAAAVCIIYLAIVLYFGGPKIIYVGLGTLLVGIILAEIINLKVKASMHMAIFTAFSIAMGILNSGFFWVLILMIPVVAWSRLRLKRHTMKEVVVGTVFGACIVLAVYGVIQYF